MERQARPRGSEAKTPAPRDRQNKFHVQGVGESSHSSPRCPDYLAHCSELPAPSRTPARLHSPLQSREGGYPRMHAKPWKTSYLEPRRISNGRKTSSAGPKRSKSQIPRRSDQTEPSETRNPLKDQLGTLEIETGAGTRTGRSRRQKGWQCPHGQTSLTSPSQGRSWSMF
ncbi:hypothetical protein F2Q69_00013405 [Brassica cretica]|uniref:Uncharacterized protein n=1 Tax=Brassica cretica TaxID=69181 RepID=A0A8S9QX54_BRACR|nr:hypothetical protein F2Q69_00013405 [Brassica cretica]